MQCLECNKIANKKQRERRLKKKNNMKNNIFTGAMVFCSGSYNTSLSTVHPVSGLCLTGLWPEQEKQEPERLATLVLAEIRRWLKEGKSIRAEEPNSDVLNLKSGDSVYDGLVIEEPEEKPPINWHLYRKDEPGR